LESRLDQPVAADAGEPQLTVGIGRYLWTWRRGVVPEILTFEVEDQPLLALGGRDPRADVVARRRVDLPDREGRLRDRLPFEIDDLSCDRHVVLDEANRQIVPSGARLQIDPADAVIRCSGHHPRVPTLLEFGVGYGELKLAVGAGSRRLRDYG